MVRAVLDTNVLWGNYPRDLLLTLAEQGAYEPAWSSRILNALIKYMVPRLAERLQERFQQQGLEHTEVVRQAHDQADDRVRGLVQTIQIAFPECSYDRWPEYVHLCHNHEDDRHVLACAIGAAAPFIVTHNLKHFPQSALAPHGVQAVGLDEFLAGFDEASLRVAMEAMVNRYRRPPQSVDALLGLLRDTYSLHQTAARARGGA